MENNLPTLTQHIKLLFKLIEIHPTKDFGKLFRLSQTLLSTDKLCHLSDSDIEFLSSTGKSYGDYSNYRHKRQVKCSGLMSDKTIAWFIETQVSDQIELFISIFYNKQISVSLKSLEDLWHQ